MGGARGPNDGHDRATTTGGMLTAPVTWVGGDDLSVQFAAGAAAALDLATGVVTAGPQVSCGAAVKFSRPKNK